MEPWEVEVAGVPRVGLEDAVGGPEVGLLALAVQLAPARPEDDDGAAGDAAVPGLPLGQVVHRQPRVGVGRSAVAVRGITFTVYTQFGLYGTVTKGIVLDCYLAFLGLIIIFMRQI